LDLRRRKWWKTGEDCIMRTFITCHVTPNRAIKSKKMRWGMQHAWKKLLYFPRRDDNIRMDFREIGWKGVDWLHLAHDRDQLRALVNTVLNLQVA